MRSRIWPAVISAVVVLAVAAGCAPASAGTWSAVPAPVVPGSVGVTIGNLSLVSCGSPTFCLAFGQSFGESWGERWDGTAWSPVRGPAGGVGALDCVGDRCLVVSAGEQGANPKAWWWNGTDWSAGPALPPAQDLRDLDCTGPTSCVLVGSDAADATKVLRLDGSTWTDISAGRPDASSKALLRIACVPGGSCIGAAISASDWTSSYQLWDGTRWSAMPTPGVIRGGSEIGCGSTLASCRVAGLLAPAAGGEERSVILRWAGSTWALDPGAPVDPVVDLACAPDDTCVAVASAHTYTLAGGRWTQGATPPATREAFVCATGTFCVAPLGEVWPTPPAGTPPSIQHWNGTTWNTVQAQPSPVVSRADLTSVSCVTATWCLAVGTYAEGDRQLALVQRWNGSAWVLGPALPAAVADAEILTVTCSAVDRCVAVGRRAGAPFLARLTGSTWTNESAVAAGQSRYGMLTDVWCGEGTCIAVGPGSAFDTFDNVALISTGGAWKEMPAPPLFHSTSVGGRTALQIDCASPRSCGAVAATATNNIFSTTSYWDGTSWTDRPDQQVEGDFLLNVGLFGLDCPMVGTCFASGMAFDAETGARIGVVVTFDGSRWNVTERQGPALGPISCTTAERCIAPGGSPGSNGLHGLVRDRGRWSPVRQPTPAFPASGVIKDVSCVPGGDTCLAVGSNPSASAPLAYRWRF